MNTGIKRVLVEHMGHERVNISVIDWLHQFINLLIVIKINQVVTQLLSQNALIVYKLFYLPGIWLVQSLTYQSIFNRFEKYRFWKYSNIWKPPKLCRLTPKLIIIGVNSLRLRKLPYVVSIKWKIFVLYRKCCCHGNTECFVINSNFIYE